jgi:hypothetical protein
VEQGWISFALAPSLRLQIYDIVFLSHLLVHLPDSGDGRYEDPGLHRSIFWECPLQEPLQAVFTLVIMYIMDLTLFFLDTFLFYIIWNTIFSIVRLFFLGLSIWMPWKDIFNQIAKENLCKVVGNPRHAGQV